MRPKGDELPRLQTRHAAVMRTFVRVKDRDNLDVCVAVLEPEDVRAEFDLTFRRFAQSLDMLLPDPRALPYVSDGKRPASCVVTRGRGVQSLAPPGA